MACGRFLDFQPIDKPTWRKREPRYECVPTVKEMIKDIVKYHEMWRTHKGKSGKNSCAKEKHKMVLEFLFRVQREEGIGLHDQRTFEEVINAEIFEKRQLPQEHSETEEDPLRKITNIEPLNEEVVYQRDSNEQESLPNSLEAKSYILENMLDKSKNEDKKIIETINILRGYWHLKKELKKLSHIEQSRYAGEIDVEICIQKLHEILMHDLFDGKKTPPGKFSVLPRSMTFAEKEYQYPSYATEGVADKAVETLVSEYNKMVEEISKKENIHEKLECLLKCATVMLFGVLTLHPFSDGNGRLARLLCSNCIKLFCPFPTAIYNVFSPSNRCDYLTAFVNAKQNVGSVYLNHEEDAIKETELILEQKPEELCSLIIESNWFTWRQFLHRIGIDIELFEFEKNTWRN